jgi:prepilin-type N-terminal cleavage/methylation domain-containing protein
MRRGYTLTELMILMAIMAVIAWPISRLTNVVMWDIPQSINIIQCNTSILNAMQFIKQDINAATALTKTEDGKLVIEQSGKTVNYVFQAGKIIRSSGEDESQWDMKGGKVDWNVWQKDRKGYAVEISKYVEAVRYNGVDKKMENSYVFFAGVQAEAVK